TSFKDVWESTGTPRGSVYFHFPDGKAALGLEVIRSALHTLLAWTDEARVESGSAVDFVERLAEKPAGFLERTGYEQGCPIAAIAIEQPSGHPERREAASHAFSAWSARIAEASARFGVPESDCPDLALATASALEGAIAISKADGS